MRIYEELFVVRPDATDEEVDPVIEQLKNVITQAGGTPGTVTGKLEGFEIQRRAVYSAAILSQAGDGEGS